MTQIIVQSPSASRASQVRPLIRAALDHEVRLLKIGLQKTTRHLQHFERQFGRESQDFYREYQTGTLGDDMDYMKWAGEYETLLQLQEDYAGIQEIQVC